MSWHEKYLYFNQITNTHETVFFGASFPVERSEMRENTELTNLIHHSKEAQMSSLWQHVSQGPLAVFFL